MQAVSYSEAAKNTYRLSAFGAALRLFAVTRGVLSLVGLAALLIIGLPQSRELLTWANPAPAPAADALAPKVNAAGPIQASARDSAQKQAQRAVAEFIAKRYRVADDAVQRFVSEAYRAGHRFGVDPLLIISVMAIESRFNPVAQSSLGAKGLMQVIPKYHPQKVSEHGGAEALLDPKVNIQVGAQILHEYLRQFGGVETALQVYAGAADQPSAEYASKVLAERSRLQRVLQHASEQG
jgi:soluble lytic murein transglycosylase-like protein